MQKVKFEIIREKENFIKASTGNIGIGRIVAGTLEEVLGDYAILFGYKKLSTTIKTLTGKVYIVRKTVNTEVTFLVGLGRIESGGYSYGYMLEVLTLQEAELVLDWLVSVSLYPGAKKYNSYLQRLLDLAVKEVEKDPEEL